MWLLAALVGMALLQSGSAIDAGRAKVMLREVRESVEKHYFDPSFGGRDLDAIFARASARLDAAKSTSDVLSALALPLMDLEDSHTVFIPPQRATRVSYGWEMAAVGERVFVASVAEGSDAQAQGLRPGDEVLAVNGQAPTRANSHR